MAAPGPRPQAVRGLAGTVVHAPFGGGSKSERLVFWLEADGRRLVLRRRLRGRLTDAGLARYVGRRVACDGVIVGYQLLADTIRSQDGSAS